MLTPVPTPPDGEPADRLPLPVGALLLRDKPPKVAVRTAIASRPGRWQQPLGADPGFGVLDLGRHQRPDALIVPATLDPPCNGKLAFDDPLDGLVGQPAHLGGPAVGADLAVGGDDVQLLPRGQQWSPLGGERCWLRHRHRHRPGPQLGADTTDARWGFPWPPVGPTLAWPRTSQHAHSSGTAVPGRPLRPAHRAEGGQSWQQSSWRRPEVPAGNAVQRSFVGESLQPEATGEHCLGWRTDRRSHSQPKAAAHQRPAGRFACEH